MYSSLAIFIPSFDIAGLLDESIMESYVRIRNLKDRRGARKAVGFTQLWPYRYHIKDRLVVAVVFILRLDSCA